MKNKNIAAKLNYTDTVSYTHLDVYKRQGVGSMYWASIPNAAASHTMSSIKVSIREGRLILFFIFLPSFSVWK